MSNFRRMLPYVKAAHDAIVGVNMDDTATMQKNMDFLLQGARVMNETQKLRNEQASAPYKMAGDIATSMKNIQEARLYPQVVQSQIDERKATTDWTLQRGKLSELEAQQKERDLQAELAGYEQWKATTQSPYKTPEYYIFETKIRPKLEEQKFKTREAGAQADIAEQKVTTGLGEQQAYADKGMTKGDVVAGTEIAQMRKAISDAKRSQIQADTEEKLRAAQIQKALSTETTGAGGYKLKDWSDDIRANNTQIDTLYNRNNIIERSIASLNKGTTMDQLIVGLAASNDKDGQYVAGLMATSPNIEDAITRLRDGQKQNLDRIDYWGKLNDILTKQGGMPALPTTPIVPTATSDKTLGKVVGDTVTIPYSEWLSIQNHKKRLFLSEKAKEGIRILDFTDNTGVMATIEIDENGGVVSSKKTKKTTTQSTGKPTVQGSQNKTTGVNNSRDELKKGVSKLLE